MALVTKKKRRRVQNRAFTDEDNPEFQVAPMADLLFVLLVFFMSITTVEVLRTDKNLKLPVAKDSKENKQKSHQVVVNVLWLPATRVGSIKIDDVTYSTPEALIPMLTRLLHDDPVLRVLIRADKNVEYSFIASIMKACSEAQISNVTFAVLSKDEPKAAGNGGGN